MQIDVDFEVYKQLTLRRDSEEVTYNDVIRDLLGLKFDQSNLTEKNEISGLDWITKGVRFPNKTEFRATYKGKIWNAAVENGGLLYAGEKYESPSAAAMTITGGPVNGWRFWECRLPGKSSWQLIDKLRK